MLNPGLGAADAEHPQRIADHKAPAAELFAAVHRFEQGSIGLPLTHLQPGADGGLQVCRPAAPKGLETWGVVRTCHRRLGRKKAGPQTRLSKGWFDRVRASAVESVAAAELDVGRVGVLTDAAGVVTHHGATFVHLLGEDAVLRVQELDLARREDPEDAVVRDLERPQLRAEREAGRGLDIFLVAFDQRGAPHGAGVIRPLHQNQCDDHLVDAGAQHGNQDQRHENCRERQLDVDDPHDQGVDLAAVVGGDQPDDATDAKRDDARHHADAETDPQPVENGTQQIPSGAVGAEPERHPVHTRGTGLELAVQNADLGKIVRIGRRNPRRKNGDEDDSKDECLVPLDYRKSGMISDDFLNRVFSLINKNTRVIAIIDACHSETMLDLPYRYISGNKNVIENIE